MKSYVLWLGFIAVAVLSVYADKPWTLQYEGSYTFPTMATAGWGDYYPYVITFVPDGATRPPWGGSPIQGPTVLLAGSYATRFRECGPIPTLVKSGTLNTAPLIPLESGGTAFNGGQRITSVDSAGVLWGLTAASSIAPTALYEYNQTAAGFSYLGTNRPATHTHCTGWLGAFPNTGVLRRGDGTGNDLPSDGHQTSPAARFLLMQHPNASPYPIQYLAGNTDRANNRFLFDAFCHH